MYERLTAFWRKLAYGLDPFATSAFGGRSGLLK